MNESKPWYLSKTVWAAIATILIGVLRSFQIALDESAEADVMGWVESLGTLVAGGVALAGRIWAQKKITGEPPVPRSFGLLAALCLLALCGCAGPGYVAADRATFEAIAPEYRAYVASDPALSVEQKQRRDRTLAAWLMRIEAAEKPLNAKWRRDEDSSPRRHGEHGESNDQ